MRLHRLAFAVALLTHAFAAHAQSASPDAPIQPLSPDEFAALRPLADHGAALLVRNADAGTRARITVLLRTHAPIATVHDVIATPEQYPQFMTSIDHLEVQSRHGSFIAVRMHTTLTIFSVDTLATLHLVSAQRVDGTLTRSQLGPGALRWDLYPAGDECYLAYTTWSDPSQGNWFIHQIAATSPTAIAGMEMSYDVMLALIVRRRAEHLAGHAPAGLPDHPTAPTGPIAPPAAGPWLALSHDRVVAGVTLDDTGAIVQSTTAMWIDAPPATVLARLRDPSHYPQVWPDVQRVQVQPANGNAVRFHTVVDSTLFRTEGDQDLAIDAGDAPTVWWRGANGDYANDVQRWDLVPAAGGGTTVLLSGGAELNRAGLVMRTLVGRVPWMLPGYSAALKMVLIQALARANAAH